LPPGVSLGAAVNEVQNAARQTLPSTISTGFSGTAQAFQASQQGLALLLLLAVVVIYIVLGILYESFVHPLTILSGLPFAGFGAGAESRRPLGLAVVGGLAFSQIITLYVTPVVYTYLDALQQRFGRRAPRSVTEPAAAD